MTEYDLPLKWGNPYDLWPDAEDNIWVENAVYNSLVKFDPRTTRWTYVPFPDLGAHTPKLDRDKEGTLWFPRRVAKRAGRVQAQGQRPVPGRANGSPIDTPRAGAEVVRPLSTPDHPVI